jgi:methionine aminopeptidase, type I
MISRMFWGYRMISIKNQREIELMREAGRIVALVHQKMAEVIVAGITTMQLDQIAQNIIESVGARPSFKGYQGFPASICVSVNEVIVHGIPNNYKLRDGDIVSIDVGACYKGYHGDSAWTYAVGNVKEEAKRLMVISKQALYKGLEFAKPGGRLSDISHAIGTFLVDNGYSIPIEFTGHGIGSVLHEDPMIPNYGLRGRGPILKSGMTLAIEPMVHIGKRNIEILNDGWTAVTKDRSLAAHYEHTILINEHSYEILTKL